MFELGNSSRPSSSPNLKTKSGVENGLESYEIIIAKILLSVVFMNNSDESICFSTYSCCIYKWQDIGRLRGVIETCVEIEQDLFL